MKSKIICNGAMKTLLHLVDHFNMQLKQRFMEVMILPTAKCGSKSYFTNGVVPIWNSLLNKVVMTDNINLFKK